MPLRCLLFSSDVRIIPPIMQVLTQLGIQGEHCLSAVDAVEKVTTQLFEIVITDWEDQPEAGFLLRMARDLKAAQRPLTLAIVRDEAKVPESLQAGANSVLMKPIQVEQVRDTMSTACELLRAKQLVAAPAAPLIAPPVHPLPQALYRTEAKKSVMASAASAPAFVTQAPEKLRAGEFLQSPGSAPGAQFDTEGEVQSTQEPVDQEVDSLTELEPMAAAVDTSTSPEVKPGAPLTGWASVQARLAASPRSGAAAKNELLAYGETPSYAAVSPAEPRKDFDKKESQHEAESEAALFAYMSGESKTHQARESRPMGKFILAGTAAVVFATLALVPGARHGLGIAYRNAAHAGASWLNPPPAPVPATMTQHDSFGQAGDEYKLPVAENIPDATTDPSQIRVLPVIDPTAKSAKGSQADGGQPQPPAGDNPPSDQNQPGSSGVGQALGVESQAKDLVAQNVTDVPGNQVPATRPADFAQPVRPNLGVPQGPASQPDPFVRPAHPASAPAVSAGSAAGIPLSLKSHLAPPAPEVSGPKPVEAAMAAIEPVSLPEAVARSLLAQPVDPVYPVAARAGGQRGSVVVQVLIGRDGVVQDVKFFQGSLAFARPAIDAVKQWRFKPYSLNGRPVSVQSAITLNFKPPA